VDTNKNVKTILHNIERYSVYFFLIVITLLPLVNGILTNFNLGFYISSYMHYAVIYICLLAGMITTREGKHLSLNVGIERLKQPYKNILSSITGFFSIAISSSLFLASLSYILIFDINETLLFIPLPFILLILPVGFCVITVRFILSLEKGLLRWIPAVLGLLCGFFFCWLPLIKIIEFVFHFFAEDPIAFADYIFELEFSLDEVLFPVFEIIVPPFLIILIASAFMGTPIFILLSGVALFFFIQQEGGYAPLTLPDQIFEIMKSDNIPAIPLFTLAGYILSESKAGERLVRIMRSLIGWLPGGLAVVSVFACAFLTVFTGGSGVTILALGGLLSYAMIQRGYKEKFTYGMLTSSGSIGLLFPPSLPLIWYGVVLQTNQVPIDIRNIFVGGFIPGIVMVAVISGLGIHHSLKHKIERVKFEPKEIIPALKDAIFELLLPLIIIFFYFSGIFTLIQTSALAVFYIFIIEVVVKKDIKIKELPEVLEKCIPIVGGILIILASAKGLSNFIVDAQIAVQLRDWMLNTIESKYIFLILLNIFLIITGCLMDIYSAIIVVAPLIIPLGLAYEIHPIHLAIIFLANLELGYLTPPVGINLFLASYRFNQPLVQTYRNILPFLLALLITVLLITYVDVLSTGLLNLIQF
jgi:C4-dicarboxylate transporter DctM subunit